MSSEIKDIIRAYCADILALLARPPELAGAPDSTAIRAATVRESFKEDHWRKVQEARHARFKITE
jgi:hypothetical protein